MLKINAIKIDIVTADGNYGFEQSFTTGLNIIRGNNSSGKSSLFQAILYALGLEELLGGKNEKTMQSVLKDQVEFPDSEFHKILQSEVYLEIENEEAITIKRAIISPTNNQKLLTVYYGKLLTEEDKNLRRQSMYIHDKGGASDEIYGFHLFLADFLGWEMPEVMNNQGQPSHLYLQQIAPLFMIEQKSGWSDFFATMPYYGIKHATSRIVEFILNMDVFENQKKKTELIYREECLRENWKTLYIKLSNIARDTRYHLQGLNDRPSILQVEEIALLRDVDTGTIDIETEVYALRKEYSELSAVEVRTVEDRAEFHEGELNTLQAELNQKSLSYDLIGSEFSLCQQQLEQYQEQLSDLDSDLHKNRSALKIVTLGGEVRSEVALLICPTCYQPIEDSLLPHNVQEVPMSIEANIHYLESKKKMIEKYIQGQKQKCDEYGRKLDSLRKDLSDIRVRIRAIKRDLTEDSRMPSISDIERRLTLKNQIAFYERKISEFEELKDELTPLVRAYTALYAEKQALSVNIYSTKDEAKINCFETFFKAALKEFKYESKPVSTIRISSDDYLPLTQLITGEKYNIRFDSSASDFIRCLWAYYISLMQTSIQYGANHPNLLIFDEPKQQDMSEEGFRTFLQKLSGFKTEQVLVFASFENKDESFYAATHDLPFNLIRIEGKLIKPMGNDIVNIYK